MTCFASKMKVQSSVVCVKVMKRRVKWKLELLLVSYRLILCYIFPLVLTTSIRQIPCTPCNFSISCILYISCIPCFPFIFHVLSVFHLLPVFPYISCISLFPVFPLFAKLPVFPGFYVFHVFPVFSAVRYILSSH